MYSSNAAEKIQNDDVIRNSVREEESMFNSMAELRAKNKEIGHLFFDHETMKFWNSKIETGLYRGTFFITSERGHGAKDKRKFTIRKALKNGAIETVGNSGNYKTLDDAKDAVKGLIKNLKLLKPLKKAK